MTKKLNPDFYYQWHEPFESVVHFFKATLLQVGWGEDNTKEVVMDVGCGPGETTTQLILPLFPSLKKVIAIDKLHDRIALACAQNFHPAIQFSVADIEEWSTIHQWKGQITKLVSVHCFHWVRNKKIGLRNIYCLLKKGGEAALFFVLEASFYEAILEIQKNPKWSFYFQGFEEYTPDTHRLKHTSQVYKGLLINIGFDIIYCKEKEVTNSYSSDHDFKSFFLSICPLTPHIPDHRKSEFEEDFFQELLRLDGRDSRGLPMHRGKILELIIKKR